MRPLSFPRGWATRLGALAVFAALFAGPSAEAARPTAVHTADTVWVASWEASPEPPRDSTPLSNQTVRQVARISAGGLYVRIQLSNEFGDQPLTVGTSHVALSAGGAAIMPGSDRPVTFGGRPNVMIPPGARVLSDPVSLKVAPLSTLAVSLYVPGSTGLVTEHAFANHSVYVGSGDQTAAPDLPGVAAQTRNMLLTGIDVSASSKMLSLVALGDSLTSGFGSTAGGNGDWPSRLAERLIARKDGPPISVVNAAIGGNRLLHDTLGPNALSRFDRDVLTRPNVGYMIVLLGINDFGYPGGHNLPAEEVSYQDVIAGLQQMIERAHSNGIKVFIATLPPFGPIPQRPGYYSEASEAKRVALNQWIRGAKGFEGVIDFETALRDPKAGNRLRPEYDSGDHLDPNDAGYKAMTDAIEARLFQ